MNHAMIIAAAAVTLFAGYGVCDAPHGNTDEKPVAAQAQQRLVEVDVNIVKAEREVFEAAGFNVDGEDSIAALSRWEAVLKLHNLLTRPDVTTLSASKILTLDGSEATFKVVTEYIYPTSGDVKLSDRFEETFGAEALARLREAGKLLGEKKYKMTIGKLDQTGGTDMTRFAVIEPGNFVTKEVGATFRVTPALKDGNRVELRNLHVSVVAEPTWENFGLKLTAPGGETCDLPMEVPYFPVRKIEQAEILARFERPMILGRIADEASGKDKIWMFIFLTPHARGALGAKPERQ